MSCVVEDSFFIARSFLERSRELGDRDVSANILLDAIQQQLRTGERRKVDARQRRCTRDRSDKGACIWHGRTLMDNLTKNGRPDRSKINMQEEYEVRYSTKELELPKDELQRTVDKIGNSAAAVRKELAV